MEIDLSKIKKVYFIGIGGIGISALAKWAKARGMEVSGVNDDEGKTIDSLREVGINIQMPKDSPLVTLGIPEADLYVYSDAWIHRGPLVLEAARKTGKHVMNYAQALGVFSKDYKTIAISGTHGKTTTTAMVADILIDAGLDPTVIVGSFVKKFGSNFRKGLPAQAGKSAYLVVEADEYNRHMLELHPYIGLVTNIEADHLDCYKDLNEIKEAFEQFFSQSENKIEDYRNYVDKVPKLLVPGEHNRMNAAAALAVADMLGINIEVAQKSLSEFAGTWRRLEKRGVTDAGTIVYDDYAHHPTEVRASLEALREIYPNGEKKITVVFQPHLYSRTKALFDDFTKCFHGADQIILLPIYFAREAKDESISSGKLAEEICKTGDKAIAFTDFELAEGYLSGQNFGKDDIFVTMGAGEAYQIADHILKFL
jgi:UDP-N-acetylmuramate--alanine ligase